MWHLTKRLKGGFLRILKADRLTRRILMEGFAIAIQQMDSFRELDEQVSEDKAIELEGKRLFRSKVHRLVRWRMNFETLSAHHFGTLSG